MTQPETPAADTGRKIPIETYVTQDDGADTFGFRCPLTCQCGERDDDQVGFSTTGWPTAALAKARGLQHIHEHREGLAGPSLHEFRIANGLTVDDAGVVRVGDLV